MATSAANAPPSPSFQWRTWTSLISSSRESFWAAMSELAIPLLIHPHYAAAADQLKGFGHALPVAVGFPFETTIALARLVLAGVLHRHPTCG